MKQNHQIFSYSNFVPLYWMLGSSRSVTSLEGCWVNKAPPLPAACYWKWYIQLEVNEVSIVVVSRTWLTFTLILHYWNLVGKSSLVGDCSLNMPIDCGEWILTVCLQMLSSCAALNPSAVIQHRTTALHLVFPTELRPRCLPNSVIPNFTWI